MANVVADKLTQANQIKEQIRTAANEKNAGIPEGAPFADYPGYLEGLPEQVENMPIALDFSGGDMEIIAPDGVVVKSAVIQKPANLTPENIAEGVDIAGIVGALAGGGGGATVATGSFTGNGSTVTVSHGLGVVPDIVVVGGGTDTTSPPYNILLFAFGSSRAFYNNYNKTEGVKAVARKTDSTYVFYGGTTIIDVTSTTAGINNATATSFNVGNSSLKTYNGFTYKWFAIAGLT